MLRVNRILCNILATALEFATPAVGGTVGAWLNYNGDNNTIRDSYNISSVTDNGTGDYTANFTNSCANDDYSVAGQCSFTSSTNDHIFSVGSYNSGYADGTDMTTSACKIRSFYSGSAMQDVEIITAIWFGDW